MNWFVNNAGIEWVEDTTTKSLIGTVPSYMKTHNIINELENMPVDRQKLNADYVTETVQVKFPENAPVSGLKEVFESFTKYAKQNWWSKDFTVKMDDANLIIDIKTNYTLEPEAFYI